MWESYKEARVKLENSKEDFKKLRLILEEEYQLSLNKRAQEKLSNSKKREESKAKRESKAKKELEKISKQRRKKIFQDTLSEYTSVPKNKLISK